jgi:Leucine-rich repeat (LRR) protein
MLVSLNLYGNKLTTVPADELVKMKKLRSLYLVNNQIPKDEIQRLQSIFATNPNITVTF